MNLLARAKSSTHLFSYVASSQEHLFHLRHITALQRCNFSATKTSHPLPESATYELGNVGFSPEKFSNLTRDGATKKKDAYQPGDLWRDLLKNPLQWYDYRQHKTNGLVRETHPDFKQKGTGNALWIRTAPNSLLPELAELECDVRDLKPTQVAGGEECWMDLVENPSKWWDNRASKRHPKAPDFKHKETGKGLWIADAPQSVLPRLGKLEGGANNHEDSWKTLVENPDKWWDNRVGKRNPRAPDFKHKETGEGLWLNRSPDWVLSKLPPFKADQNTT